MMSSSPTKSAGDARCTYQDPFIVPYDLDSNLYKEYVLSTWNAINGLASWWARAKKNFDSYTDLLKSETLPLIPGCN